MRLTAVNFMHHDIFEAWQCVGTARAAFQRGRTLYVEINHSIPINPATRPTTER